MADITLDLALDELLTDTPELELLRPKQEAKPHHRSHLQIQEKSTSSHLLNISVEVDKFLTEQTYAQAVNLFRGERLDGFKLFNTPTEYLEMNYKSEIAHRVKQYLFHHFVLDFLLREISKKKILLANYPRLTSIDFDHQKSIKYSFDVSIAQMLELKEWRHFSFKMPKRKKYKDLDKQVINFLDHELDASRQQKSTSVEEADWVLFTSTLINGAQKTIAPDTPSTSFWTKINLISMPNPFAEEFLHKKINDSFYSNALELDTLLSNYDGKVFSFLITIKSIVKGKYLNLEHLKNAFKLKNKVEIHNKLMEVFSYRNDISQRKAIIEELFHLFLTKHRFEIPKHLVLRRQEDILHALMKQPDYQVYRSQKDFIPYIELLAEKQLKEEIIIDHVAHKENISVDTKDLSHYLHFFNNKRLKEFIYFKPIENIEEQAKPVNISILSQAVGREKTLNFIIHTLTK